MNRERDLALPRTDLACERLRADADAVGVEYSEEEGDGYRISRLRVTSREGAESIGKPEGRYVTLSFPPLFDLDDGAISRLAAVLARLLQELCEGAGYRPSSVLVVGLGNRYMTADAIGPESVRRIPATRHLRLEDPALFEKFSETEVALLAPGVMAQTGIEAQLLVAGAVETVQPDMVIAIDALAARSTSRLATTVQLSDTGIRPGSGIGNPRRAIDSESLGVPVLAIGVPTVVDTRTLVYDAFQRAGLSDGEIPARLGEVLTEGEAYFVSPRQSDTVTERAAQMVATAVNLTFSAGLFGEE